VNEINFKISNNNFWNDNNFYINAISNKKRRDGISYYCMILKNLSFEQMKTQVIQFIISYINGNQNIYQNHLLFLRSLVVNQNEFTYLFSLINQGLIQNVMNNKLNEFINSIHLQLESLTKDEYEYFLNVLLL
jgi:hypothetical protein